VKPIFKVEFETKSGLEMQSIKQLSIGTATYFFDTFKEAMDVAQRQKSDPDYAGCRVWEMKCLINDRASGQDNTK
jgi:phage terminase large subunit-like protein